MEKRTVDIVLDPKEAKNGVKVVDSNGEDITNDIVEIILQPGYAYVVVLKKDEDGDRYLDYNQDVAKYYLPVNTLNGSWSRSKFYGHES